MARYLITGARAPVALEFLRNLARYGHTVYMSDSVCYPLAKNSRYLQQYLQLPKPDTNIQLYQQELLETLQKYHIDYLLPTCEEIFYISKIKEILSKYCVVLCENFELLSKLHSKYEIQKIAVNCGISLPSTKIVDAEYLKSNISKLSNFVIKKEFCRFGVDVILKPNIYNIEKFLSRVSGRNLTQQKITGTEYCSYSIATNGRLNLHSCYRPLYRVNASAGIYFKPVVNAKILQFVKNFLRKTNYSGQIGFDYIATNDDIYLIECNPRATSGLHLCSDKDFSCSLLGMNNELEISNNNISMIGLAMFLNALPKSIISFNLRRWYGDYLRAHDVISSKTDKSFIFYQMVSFYEIIKTAISRNISIRDASMIGIGWNGENMK